MDKLNFKIVSSKWLETFKSSQTFALHQTVSAKEPFQPTSQELLIRLYDSWFEWLADTEKRFSALSEVSNDDRHALIREAVTLQAQQVSSWSQDALLDNKLTTLWTRAYKPAHEAYVAFLRALPPGPRTQCFSQIAEKLLSFLQHCLFVMHEVDTLLRKPAGGGIISVDDYGCEVYNSQGRDLLGERLRLYQRESTSTAEQARWEVKQYAERQLPSGWLNQIEASLPGTRT